MSDNTLLVEVAGDDPLWELVLDVAERLPTGTWVLVGGAMTWRTRSRLASRAA